MKHMNRSLPAGGLALAFLISCNNSSNPGNAEAGQSHAGHNMGGTTMAGYADSVNAGLIATDTMKGSPHRTAMATIGDTHVHIEYSSPGVKGRNIWGGLVAWNQVWVAGAHQATSVRFYKDVVIDNTHIPAGTYGLFAIPDPAKWTMIINSRYEQHLTDQYNPAEDLVRATCVPEAHAMTERLTYNVKAESDSSGFIELKWERVAVRLPFKTL